MPFEDGIYRYDAAELAVWAAQDCWAKEAPNLDDFGVTASVVISSKRVVLVWRSAAHEVAFALPDDWPYPDYGSEFLLKVWEIVATTDWSEPGSERVAAT